MDGEKGSYGFYKPHPLAIWTLIISVIMSIIVWWPSNFTAKIGEYYRLFYIQVIFILIVAFGSVVLAYILHRGGADKEVFGSQSEPRKEGEK